jgi:hypothetical protein
MLTGLPHRWIAFVLVLALSAGAALPAWASYLIPVPGHHFTIVAAPIDRVEYHCDRSCEACDGTHHNERVSHADCVICLGLALPAGVPGLVRELPSGFEIGRQTDGAGVQSDLDPHPPRSPLHRI